MPGGRKGFYQELQIKKHLTEITPRMFAHLMKILEGDDEKRKDEAMHKILPKIIDKALPTQITGDEGEAFQISISVAKEIAEKQKLYDTTPDATGNSEGQPQI